MTVVEPIDVDVSCDEVLRRLHLAAPAFAARPAAAMVGGILDMIRRDRLLAPRATFRCIEVSRGDRRRVDLEDGSALELARPVAQWARAQSVVAAAWSLGPDISRAVSEAFQRRRALQGLLLDQIASLLVFRLGEGLFGRLRQQFAARGLRIGRPLAPGDGTLSLATQGALLRLADARRIGIELGQSGVMSPLKTATAVAAVGRRIRQPRRDWSCSGCARRGDCRLRADRTTGAGHGDTLCG